MARLFISHSSANNDKAVEVRDWLAKNGWDDVFLDLDPERGIVAGQRWKDALQKAAYRCEVVLALVSKEWLASGWCKSEIDAARLMGKKIIVALVGVDKGAVPLDLTDEQFIDLTNDPQAYRRLKEGLKRSGLDPTTFPFDADRPPYPGFAYLEEKDAAVFFGRDAQIVRGLDEIRRLARVGITRMLVILGASGSGKSSFLRAGLWPRLKRDDLAWMPLPIVRPERAAMSGKYGLAESLYETASDPRFAEGVRQRGLARSRVDIQDFIEKNDDGLAQLLAALRDIAQAGASDENAPPPTILLAIDQGEELFNEEGRDEARRFIDIVTRTLAADPRALAILVMRSDAFPLVQNEPTLAALPKDTFTLDMMLEGSFRAVIEGPAGLLDPPLLVDPQLVDALLEDISGQDALPLLAFTLRHLYDNTRVDNALTLAGYDKIGRVKGVIAQTVEQAYAEAVAKGEAPKDKEERLKLARAAFIPHLAQVNPAGQFVRRVSPRDKIPPEAWPLVDRFAEQRLLIRDRRQGAEVIEVAHEALLRQPPFSDWLSEDREFLLWRDRLTQARTAFEADERGLLSGRELAIARSYLQTRAEREFEPPDLVFIRDSIAADDKRRAEEAQEEAKRQAAERVAAAQRRTTRAVLVGLIFAVLVAAVAVWQYLAANQARKEVTAQRAVAERYLREAQIAQSRYEASVARQKRMGEGDAVAAILLASEALPDPGTGWNDRPFVPEAENQLYQGQREQRERFIFGHEDTVNSAAFSSDGKRIVTASSDMTARLWDAATGKPIGEPFKGHDEAVLSAAFNRAGTRIATASRDKTVRMWDVETGKPIGEPLKGHQDSVNSAAFSPDGKRIVTASDDATARVWDAETGKPIGEPLRGHTAALSSAAFSPEGARIVTASADKTVRLWDATTGAPIGEPIDSHDRPVRSAAFNQDGKFIVTASDDMSARVWDAETRQQIGEPLKGHKGSVNGAAFSRNGKRIVTASDDGTAQVWDAKSGRPIGGPLGGHGAPVYGAAFSPDGKRVVTASADHTARLWNLASHPDAGDSESTESIFLSPDGKRVVLIGPDGATRLMDANDQPIGEPLGGPDKPPASLVVFSPDSRRLVIAFDDNTAQLWDGVSGKPIGEPLRGHDGAVLSAAFNRNGTRIVTGSEDKTARLWDVENGKPIGEPLRGHEKGISSAAFSPDGTRIVTASQDGTARLWDSTTSRPIGEPFKGHNGAVVGAAFSPDGSRLVTASEDGTVRQWDVTTGRPIGDPLRAIDDRLTSVEFSPNGSWIVTMSGDRNVRLWDAVTGQPIAAPIRGAFGVAFSPDSSHIIVFSRDNKAQTWDIAAIWAKTEELISHAKAAVPRCFSTDQRKAFFLNPEPPAWCIEMEKWPYNTPPWKQWLADVRAGKKPPLPAAP